MHASQKNSRFASRDEHQLQQSEPQAASLILQEYLKISPLLKDSADPPMYLKMLVLWMEPLGAELHPLKGQSQLA
jgi:hypothetical protein